MAKTISVLASIYFLGHQVCLAKESSLQRGENAKLQYALFKDHLFHSLDVPKIYEAYVLSGKHCLLGCVKNRRCFSTNIAAISTQAGDVLCQLLSSDKYNSSENFGQSQVFHHYSILSPCKSFPCQHGGTCHALYEENDYICNCTKSYTGRNCELLPPCDVENGWKAFNSSCYKYFTDNLIWTEATTVCEELNGSLVSLNSREEYEFVYTDVLPDSYRVWIGLRDVTISWIKPRWVDGSVLAYEKWGQGQPDKRNGSECVIALNGGHFGKRWYHVWNDRSCTLKLFPFVCETKQNQPY